MRSLLLNKPGDQQNRDGGSKSHRYCQFNGTMRSRGRKAPQSGMALIIRSSDIHAAGCYTTTRIPKGKRVAEYTGPRLTKDEADVLYESRPITYLFGLGDGSIVID